MKYFGRLLLIISFLFSSQTANAIQFIVRHIEVQGNQRLTKNAVLSYLPVQVGQRFDTDQSAQVISALFRSGYFSNVQLLRRKQTLIVVVQEYPTLSAFTISGNKEIKTSKIKPIMKQLKIEIGDIYQPDQIKKLKTGLLNAYHEMGYYDVAITVSVKKGPYNTVAVHFEVVEGVITKVRSIRFEGNHAFSSHQLRSQFTLTTSGVLTLLTHHDRYSLAQLESDLNALTNFYYDHGYLDFKVLSKKVSISPDHQHVDIVIHVYEGPKYFISGYRLTGQYATDPGVQKLITLRQGQLFSRRRLLIINGAISKYLANRGYAFSNIQVVPQLNRVEHTVFLVINIDPGKHFYVRMIHVSGNSHTTEKTVRFSLRQLEGSSYSLEKIQESTRRIANLPYFRNIQVTPEPVPDSENQVDLNYHVDEVNAGRASIQGGYSDVDGFLYGANISEPNFMGSGELLSVGFQRSSYAGQYSITYSDPFYTDYGLSRAISVYYTHTTPDKVNLDAYTMDTYGGMVNYALPVSEFNNLLFGYGYNHVAIGNVNPTMISPEAYVFLQQYPPPYNNFFVSVGLSHASLDRAIFPTSGNVQEIDLNVSVPLFGSSLSYYKVNYSGEWYFPISHSGFIIHPHTTLGYGDGYGDTDAFPFFMNFFGGGLGTLPGYEPNTLGPQNPNQPGNAIGGNVQIFGGLNLIFPNGLGEKIRTSWFTGFGNIFQTNHVSGNPGNPAAGSIQYDSISFSNLRWSTGLLVSWQSPLGIISFGYSIPFNVKGAQVERFGFTFGTSL